MNGSDAVHSREYIIFKKWIESAYFRDLISLVEISKGIIMPKFEKKILFYRIMVEPSVLFNGEDINSRLEDVFHTAFTHTPSGLGSYSMISENKRKKDVVFDIYEFSKEGIFGSFGASNVLSTFMMRLRDISTQNTDGSEKFDKVEPLGIPTGKQLEAYTFFYISFKHRMLSVIASKKASSVETKLQEYMDAKSTTKITFLPIRLDDLRSKSLLMRTLNKISMVFSDGRSSYKMLSELNSLSDGVEQITCELKYGRGKEIQVESIDEIPMDQFHSFKIQGNAYNEDGVMSEDESFLLDLIKKTFTKSIKIMIDPYNLSNVKDELHNSIIIISKNCK